MYYYLCYFIDADASYLMDQVTLLLRLIGLAGTILLKPCSQAISQSLWTLTIVLCMMQQLALKSS